MTITEQRQWLADERRFVLAILAKRREARAELDRLLVAHRDYLGSAFIPMVRAKATLDAAERDARSAIGNYRADKAAFAEQQAQRADAIRAQVAAEAARLIAAIRASKAQGFNPVHRTARAWRGVTAGM
jgi:hypothetical protein